MAAKDALNSQPDAFQGSPFIDGIDHVLAARWLEAAMGAEQGRQCPLIQAYGEDEDLFQHG
jgi:hypothetical protein